MDLGMLGEGCQIPTVYLQKQSSSSGPGGGMESVNRVCWNIGPLPLQKQSSSSGPGGGMESVNRVWWNIGPLPPVVWLSSPINLRLMAGRAAGNITHAVFPLHLSTVGHFHLQAWDIHTACQSWKRLLMCPGLASRLNISQGDFLLELKRKESWFPSPPGWVLTLDLLGEAHTLRVREGFGLLVYVPDVEHLTHELNHWLCLVEGSGWDCGDRGGTAQLRFCLPEQREALLCTPSSS